MTTEFLILTSRVIVMIVIMMMMIKIQLHQKSQLYSRPKVTQKVSHLYFLVRGVPKMGASDKPCMVVKHDMVSNLHSTPLEIPEKVIASLCAIDGKLYSQLV